MMLNNITIVGGIVLFNPDLNLLQQNILTLLPQVDLLVLIDNSDHTADPVLKMAGEKVSIFSNNKNLGIARALNQIFEFAEKHNADWVLTMDQDSVAPDNMIFEYFKYLDSSIGTLCPVLFDRNMQAKPETFDGTKDIKECITSGSLVNVSAWKAVFGFDEKLFIDGVDFDFCERLRRAGFRVVSVGDIILSHAIGNITMRKFLFWNVAVKNHTAFRKYYIARNTIYLAKKNGTKARVLKSYLQVIKQLGIVLLYEADKGNKVRAILRGTRDAIKGF
ncbi:glycosyltransferase family 2 protein [Bifidobacterium apri]|uniref:glycosyltransferase family 2 protein n=1 Tax=Bifidobacterium apri TaxID=1769423 RepID=UPI003996C8C2